MLINNYIFKLFKNVELGLLIFKKERDELMKKTMLLILVIMMSFITIFASSTKVFAFRELGTDSNGNPRSVNITLAEDFETLYTVRTVEKTITDSGRFNQIHDSVNFNSVYDGKYNLDNLYNQGYRTMAVEITMDVKEIHDGYQYIYIYDDTSTTSYLSGGRFEHGPGKKDTQYKTYTFYFEIDINNVRDNDFVIRYGASGAFKDDWVTKNVKVQVGWSKETVITSHVWTLEWINSNTYRFTQLPIAI